MEAVISRLPTLSNDKLNVIMSHIKHILNERKVEDYSRYTFISYSKTIKIIRIQALIRGFLIRKKYYKKIIIYNNT